MKYTIEAKPTFYNGVQFRSRREARWAAYFDIMGERWTYEPIDFGLWSPDFAIWDGDNPSYVEVKPIIKLDSETTIKMMTSGASVMFLVGLNQRHWWIKAQGWNWRNPNFNQEHQDENWAMAGNITQWLL